MARYKINPSFIIKKIQDDVVLLNVDTGDYFGLNNVGADFLNLIDGIKSVDDIIYEMFKEYDIDRKTIETDISELCDSLEENNIILKV